MYTYCQGPPYHASRLVHHTIGPSKVAHSLPKCALTLIHGERRSLFFSGGGGGKMSLRKLAMYGAKSLNTQAIKNLKQNVKEGCF